MLIRRVELVDFRSYARLSLDLEPHVTVLVGPNGQGKTNLIEALVRASVGSSHRVAGDQALVREGTEQSIIRVTVTTDEQRTRTVELELGQSGRNRQRVDGQDVRRAADLYGVVRVILFAPEDLALVRGDPSERRRFLDDALAQRRPVYATARSDYERVLRQRNQLLKQMRGLATSARSTAMTTLSTWTEQLIGYATQVTAARIAALATINQPVQEHYRHLAGRDSPVGIRYVMSAQMALATGPVLATDAPSPTEIAALLRQSFEAMTDREIDRGLTLIGPHRDDLELTIDQLPARTHASHGEAWSLALALKLATYDLLADVGDRPMLILDDVFAELDEQRRLRLAQVCASYDQVLVTAAVEGDVPLEGHRLAIRKTDRLTTVVSPTSNA